MCLYICVFPATVSLPATIVTSSVPTSMAGHMMYPSPHTVMYASAPTLADGGLAVLNAFSQGSSAMQVSHGQAQDSGMESWRQGSFVLLFHFVSQTASSTVLSCSRKYLKYYFKSHLLLVKLTSINKITSSTCRLKG